MSEEAAITINGTPLNEGQSLAIRVACTETHVALEDPDYLGDDEEGRRMAAAYRQRLKEVMSLLVKPYDGINDDAEIIPSQPVVMTEGQQEVVAAIIGRDRRRL